MLQNAYFLAKIGADTAENERNFAEILPEIGSYPTGRDGKRGGPGGPPGMPPMGTTASVYAYIIFHAEAILKTIRYICFRLLRYCWIGGRSAVRI